MSSSLGIGDFEFDNWKKGNGLEGKRAVVKGIEMMDGGMERCPVRRKNDRWNVLSSCDSRKRMGLSDACHIISLINYCCCQVVRAD